MERISIIIIMLCMIMPRTESQNVADVHSHNVFPFFRDFIAENGAAMEETYPLPDWDETEHLKFMEETGIGISLLSMPAPHPYYGDIGECRDIVRRYNVECAALKSKYPGRFRFCASLPLPDVEAAVDEAVFALDSLGADAIKIATNTRGLYLGDVALDPLMEVLDSRGAVVVLHPHRPVPVNEQIISAAPLALYEYPAETTRAVLNMILRNVPARYANIRFVIPHCGSFLPLALPRAKSVYKIMEKGGGVEAIDWDSNLKNFYYDLAGGLTPEVLDVLLSFTTPSHLLYGSDYPYQPAGVLAAGLKRLQDMLQRDKRVAPHADDILRKNAERLFAGEGKTQVINRL